MPIELTAHSEPGARLVAIAEQLSEQLASRAAEHDRDDTYPFEAINALKAAGYFAAPVPVELGGLGVSSAHDHVVASSRERYAYAMVPTDAPGVVVHDDWDALGMRASGSNSITLEGVELPESGVRGGLEPATRWHTGPQPGRRANPRHRLAWDRRVGRPGSPPGHRRADQRRRPPRILIAENAIDLAVARGVLSRAAILIDEHHTANAASDGTPEELGALFAEAQAAKAFVNEATTRTVDRALALPGGAGYLNGSPLARAYRDVKAGSFMRPLGANRAYDYLGHVALGEQTSLH